MNSGSKAKHEKRHGPPLARRVWVVSELYYPELTSTGYFLTGIAEGLAKDYRVSVLCGQPSYLARGVRAPVHELRNGVDVTRSWATTLNKNRLHGRLLNLVTISISIFISALLRFRRGDVVIVVTNPPLLPYLTALACRMRGAQFVVLVHDLYPEILVRLGVLRERSALYGLFKKASRWLFTRAAGILVVGRDMRELVQSDLPEASGLVRVATNWANMAEIMPKPRSENALLRSLGLSDKFVVQFFGNMGRPHCIEDLVTAAELLRDDPQIHFLVVGWGARKAWALAEKQARKLDNLTILDPLSREESCTVQNACDIAINALYSSMTGISVPSRTYNALAAGKPLLAVCEERSEIAAVVREEQVGWVVPPEHPELIACAVREAKADRAMLEAIGQRARRAAESKYSADHVLQVYRDLIEELQQGEVV